MKLLIFILGLAVASATIVITPTLKDTTVSHTYQDVSKSFIYKYEAFINTTLPQHGVEFVGQKITCDVELNVLTTQILHMNLTNVRVQEVNRTYSKVLKDQDVSYSVQTHVWDSSLTQDYTEALKNPITFQYVNGKILKFFAIERDPEWVVNMKKGIINMLTLRLENENVFSKREEGISGTCQSVYEVKERYNKDNVKTFNITKVRDLTNCTDSPYFLFKTDDLKTKDCKEPECTKEMTKPLKAIATFKYNVTGERNQLFVESCTSNARYAMSPTVNPEDGSYVVFQNQSLVLKEVLSKKINDLPKLIQRGSIKFNFPEIVNDIDRWNSTLRKVEYFTNVLSQNSFLKFDAETPSHFINLVRSLRECNITQLRQVWAWTQRTMYKRDWIVKALPYSNKTDMTQLVKEMFVNRTIDITKHGEELLVGLGSVQKPCIRMIQDIRDVCQGEMLKEPTTDVTRQDIMKTLSCRRACWVSLGNMIHRFKQDQKFVPSSIVRSMNDCEQTWMNPLLDTSLITKITYRMLEEVKENDVKLHCIEAKGNTGLPDYIKTLKEIIEEKTQPVDHRITAVTALRRIAHQVPRQVMTILLPIMRNPVEDPELRIISYLNILECEPTPATLALITEDLNKWTNPEVRIFILTHLKNLAKSTNPLEKKIAMAARYAILFVHPFNSTFTQSQNRRIEFFTDDKKVGAKCELDTVFSKQNVMPRRVSTKCDLAIYGQYMEIMELNVHTDSLNDVLDRLFGKHGSWSKRKSIFDMLAEKRMVEPTDYTKDELSKLKLKVDPYTKTTHRHASTQFKIFDTEVWYKKLDDQFFDEIMDVGKLDTKWADIERELLKPQQFNFTKVAMTEVHQQFPTIVGLPLSWNATGSAIIRIQANTTFVAQPSLQDNTHTDLVAKVDVKPEVMWINMQRFGCHTPLNKIWTETNNTINFTLPLSTKFVVDYETKKYSFEVEHMKKDRVDVIGLRHNLTLVHEKTMCGMNQVYKKNITVINGTQTGRLVNDTMCFKAYDDCASICVNYTRFSKPERLSGPIKDLFFLTTPSIFEVFAEKGSFTPDKIVFEYQPLRLSEWPEIKTIESKIRFAVENPAERRDFVERSLVATLVLTKSNDQVHVSSAWTRSDISDWRAEITGLNPTGDLELEFKWGKPKEHTIMVNNTEMSMEREHYMKFTTDRWVLPHQTLHNMTLLWAEVPEWMKTVGQTYKTFVPSLTKFVVRTLTPWDITIEPKRSWMDDSYQVCMKTKTKDTVDLIFVMPDQEIFIKNMTTPVHTDFLKKSMPAIVESVIKPDINIIPKPSTCKISSKGKIQTFDSVKLDYVMPGSCPHVLVRDCSSDEKFSVLVQNVTLREQSSTVKTGLKAIVYVKKQKFELITELAGDLTTKKLTVKVNGQRILENLRSLQHADIEIENTNLTVERNDTHISLISDQGLEVALSVDNLQVNVTHRHWNSTCGLCGNNDGEKQNEFRTPWTNLPTHVTDPIKFGVSWLVQGDDCEDRECKLKKFASFPINLITDEEIRIGETKAACFSTEPVFYCPKDCIPVSPIDLFPNYRFTPEMITVEVGFTCIRTTDPILQYTKMKDLQFATKLVDFVKTVEVPQKCICSDSCLQGQSKTQW